MWNGAGMRGSIYNKIIDPIRDTIVSLEALIEEAFGGLMGDQRESLRVIYVNTWGLYTLVMDIVTALGLDKLSTRSYLLDELHKYINPMITKSQELLDEVDGPLTEEQQVAVEFVHQTSNLLLRFVQNLWISSQIQQNTLAIQKQAFDLSSVFQDINLQQNNDDIDLHYTMPNDIPLVYGDPEKTRLCLHYILQNALWFTESGSVDIQLSHKRNRVEVLVQDSGIGIAPHHLSQIFDPFWQHDKNTEGLGLGLFIARALLHLQGSRLSVESQIGQGTKARFSLPTASTVQTST